MTLWIIGDSYATHKKQSKKYGSLEDSWIERTGRLLGENVNSNSKISITIEYIFNKFNNISHQFNEKDILILSIPYFERRWHFRKHPLKIFFPTEEEQEAIDYYNHHLKHFTEIHKTYLENFLCHVNHISKKLDLHTIMLPTFYDSEKLLSEFNSDFKYISFPNKSLGEISYLELKTNYRHDETITWLQTQDPRVNHLSKLNHIILSNKIINNIKNKTKLDFTTEFLYDFFDFNLANDEKFIKDQLFDNIMKRAHNIKLNNLL